LTNINIVNKYATKKTVYVFKESKHLHKQFPSCHRMLLSVWEYRGKKSLCFSFSLFRTARSVYFNQIPIYVWHSLSGAFSCWKSKILYSFQ